MPESRQAERADAFRCISMHMPSGHLQQRARSGRLFRMGAGKTDEHPAGCGTAKARRPGVPDGSILPTLIDPGTLAYPHVSASSAFLPTLLRRSHEATARVTPGRRATLSAHHCLLPLALSQAPAACECANLTKFQGCGWWMHIATHRTLDSTLWPLPLSQRFPAALLLRECRRQVRGMPQAHAAKPMLDAPCVVPRITAAAVRRRLRSPF